MDRIAFIFGETFLYWSSIILTLAVLAAVCFFAALRLYRGADPVATGVVIPLAMVLSLILGRFMHWYCRADSYVSFLSAMTDYSFGGYALMGVFGGCALAAAILRMTRVIRHQQFLLMLDDMSLAGCGGIALGRLACFFNTADRGQIVNSVQSLPWVYPVVNSVSGAEEYRLATFVIQAMVTAAIFAGLLVFYFKTEGKRKDGDLTLVFLLCYCASQVVLDSTRYDSLFFRSNGFVSIVQVLSALALGLAMVVFSIRWVKQQGFRKWYIGVWAGFAAAVGLAGYMEYHVQRHGDQAVFAYSVMSTCLVLIVALVLTVRHLADRPGRKAPAPQKVKKEKPQKHAAAASLPVHREETAPSAEDEELMALLMQLTEED